jgi:hypothetical protein
MRFGILAYGPRTTIHREATLAALTICAYAPAQSEIIVLTDRPAMYRWLGSSITIDSVRPETLRAWRGPLDDKFRPKLEAVRQLAATSRVDVALVDADTLTRRDLTPFADRLAAGAVMMHRREYQLAAPPRRNDRHLAREVVGRSWQGIAPDRATASMWNSGVIASSHRWRGIFDRALAVFDELRPVTRYFAVDQLACSIVFPTFAPIEEAAGWFDHYWANRPWFDRAAERFLSGALLEGLTPERAVERARQRPIVGALDGRPRGWSARFRHFVSAAEPAEEAVPESMDVDERT